MLRQVVLNHIGRCRCAPNRTTPSRSVPIRTRTHRIVPNRTKTHRNARNRTGAFRPNRPAVIALPFSPCRPSVFAASTGRPERPLVHSLVRPPLTHSPVKGSFVRSLARHIQLSNSGSALYQRRRNWRAARPSTFTYLSAVSARHSVTVRAQLARQANRHPAGERPAGKTSRPVGNTVPHPTG